MLEIGRFWTSVGRVLGHTGLVALAAAMTACGGANAGELLATGGIGGGAGGMGGQGGTEPPTSDSRTFELECLRPDVDLSFEIGLLIELDEPFGVSESTDLTFTPSVILGEESVAALIEAGVETVDITAMALEARVEGAAPNGITSALDDTPIQDFDLAADPDDDGSPGPHRFVLLPIDVRAFVAADADQVEFVLGPVSFEFGDFRVPASCVDGISVVGNPLIFPVIRD